MSKPGAARDIGIGVFVRGWTQVMSLLVVIVASHVLARQDFGTYAIASVFMIVLSTIMYSGLYEYIIKTEDYRGAADTCFWLNLAFAAGGATIICAIAPSVAAMTRTPEVSALMVLLAPSALIAALTSWQEALVLRHKSVTSYYIVWFLSETVSAALAIGLFLHGGGVRSLVAYRYCQLVTFSLGYVAHARDVPGLAWRTPQARLALAFASRLYGSRLIGIVANYSPDLIIGTLVGPAAAGAYRLASRMVFGVSEIWFQPIKTVAWVRFSHAVRATGRVGRDWPALMTALSMVAWPVLGGVAVLSRPLTDAVLGAAWDAAAPIVVVLAVAKAGELFEVFLDPLLATSGGTRRLLMLRAAAAVLAVTGLVLLARFGAPAAAGAQAATYAALAAVTIREGLRRTRLRGRDLLATLRPGIATTLAVMLGAAVTAHVTRGMGAVPVARFACDVGGAAAAYGFMTGVVFRRKIRDVAMALKEPGQRPTALGA
jgi:O-antigen/teichoic acid export membrane protein